jgi:hypothetical protein
VGFHQSGQEKDSGSQDGGEHEQERRLLDNAEMESLWSALKAESATSDYKSRA